MKWHTVTRLFTEMYNFLPFVFLVVKWFLHRKLRLLLIKITGQSKVIWSSRSKSRLAFIFYLILYHLTISLVKNKMANKMVVHCCSIKTIYLCLNPSITDGVHRNENLVEIIPVFSTFSNFFKKKKKKNYKSHFM